MKDYEISEVLMSHNLDRAVSYYGIEGTESAIKRIYSNMPKLKNKYLKFFRKKYNLKNDTY